MWGEMSLESSWWLSFAKQISFLWAGWYGLCRTTKYTWIWAIRGLFLTSWWSQCQVMPIISFPKLLQQKRFRMHLKGYVKVICMWERICSDSKPVHFRLPVPVGASGVNRVLSSTPVFDGKHNYLCWSHICSGLQNPSGLPWNVVCSRGNPPICTSGNCSWTGFCLGQKPVLGGSGISRAVPRSLLSHLHLHLCVILKTTQEVEGSYSSHLLFQETGLAVVTCLIC